MIRFLFFQNMPGVSSKISLGGGANCPLWISYVCWGVPCVEEQRVCPDDGKTYTFSELQEAYKGALAILWLLGVKNGQVAKHKYHTWYRREIV